ncbi:PBP1A family penicillin-binding protein [bacterium]|nr:PBP1A family penicillin-binding protein [bacterium]
MKKKLRILLTLLASSLLLAFISGFILITFINSMKFTIDLSQYQPKELTKIYDASGSLLFNLYAEKRELVRLKNLPEFVPNAVIAIEDRDFYSHKGISTRGLMRAFVHDITTFSMSQGGSTITQQLAKNMTNKAQKRITRKINEALFALKIEMNYTKNQIVELYINQINYGYGIWGIAMASQAFFNKTPSELTLAQAALLAGLPQLPGYYNPHKYLDRAIRRQRIVLKKMLEYKFITKRNYDDALKEKIIISNKKKKAEEIAPYFKDHIVTYLLKKYGYKATFNGGLKVYTTLRRDVQVSLRNSLSKSKKQGGIITLDPRTGAILGMVGGKNYSENKFNRVTQAKRQCGSAFKIFLYTTYIGHRIGTLADLWNDTPIHFPSISSSSKTKKLYINEDEPNEDEETKRLLGWIPHDYSKYSGPSIVYDAIRESINIIAIKVLLATGINEVIKTAHQMGIKSFLKPVVSLPLGANEVTPLEMADAVSPLANGGFRVEPFSIEKIENARGDIIESHKIIKRKVLDGQTVYVMDWALKNVVRHGTGRRAYIKGYPIAGKTGTTNNFTDAWFVGFTPNYVTIVYVGNDDPSKTLGYGRSGGIVAAPIWKRAMLPILKKDVPLDFPISKDIVFKIIDRNTGFVATGQTRRRILLPFIKGTEVTKKSLGKKEDLLWNNLKDIKWLE